MNQVFLHGRITADPELRYTQKQLAVVSFTIAIDRRLSADKKAQAAQTSDFIRCKSFGKQAEFLAERIRKGGRLNVEGHLVSGSYDKDGKKTYTMEVLVDRLQIIDLYKGYIPDECSKDFDPTASEDDEVPF